MSCPLLRASRAHKNMTNAKKEEPHKLALAIDPASRGFGYALFEGPSKPLDWGVTSIRFQKNKRCLDRIKKIIKYYQPEVIILEECNTQDRVAAGGLKGSLIGSTTLQPCKAYPSKNIPGAGSKRYLVCLKCGPNMKSPRRYANGCRSYSLGYPGNGSPG